QAGDVILSIDGTRIADGETIEGHLRGKVGEEVIVGIRRALPSGEDDPDAEPAMVELDAILEPISASAYERLRRAQRERSAQALVDEASDGRIGYLHIESMNQASLDEFERDLYAVADGRDGLIIDVRNNGGGWTADRLLSSITAMPHAYTVPRGSDPSMRSGYPQDRLFIQRYVLPINMLCNEKSFSNAEITAHAFKTLKRGTLVGEQTYGGVISTGGTSLVDGTSIRLPFRGWYLLDGTDMENNGAIPDIVVPQDPADEASGHDEQLRVALADLMDRLPDRSVPAAPESAMEPADDE
ncbi:MAG: S41 family peptidase, partial [Planctomycetota bacterium]|nr:S41 family peptidase [Planctomycetota bacterium]